MISKFSDNKPAFNLKVDKSDTWPLEKKSQKCPVADRSMFQGKKYTDVFTSGAHPEMQDNGKKEEMACFVTKRFNTNCYQLI